MRSLALLLSKQRDRHTNMNLGGLLRTSDGQCGDMPTPSCESPSVVENLKRRKLSLTKQLSDVNNALAALEDNPEVMKVLELLAKV